MQDAALADGHALVMPSHVITKNNILLGSLTFMPVSLLWMDSKQAKAQDSMRLLDRLESHVAISGGKFLCFACMSNSPYYNMMAGRGFNKLCDTTLFLKGI